MSQIHYASIVSRRTKTVSAATSRGPVHLAFPLRADEVRRIVADLIG